MPIAQKFQLETSIGLNEFLDYAQHNVDVSDKDGLLSLSEKFAMLGNNREFLSDFFSRFIREIAYKDPLSVLLSQSVVIARCRDFYLRANFWLPAEDMTKNESVLYAYDQPHDHNFDLLSLAYCGDGYVSDGFIYSYDKVTGYIGEQVELLPLGAHKHACGDVLLYECNKDIHIQHPPNDPSITLNVIPLVNQNGLRDQFFFEIESVISTRGIIRRHAPNIIEQRKYLFDIAKHIANDEIAQLFIDISKSHHCNRTRYEAIRALKTYSLDMHDDLAYSLRDDSTPIIQHYISGVLN